MYQAQVSRKTKEGLTVAIKNEYLTRDGVVKGIETMTAQLDDAFETKRFAEPQVVNEHPNDENGH